MTVLTLDHEKTIGSIQNQSSSLTDARFERMIDEVEDYAIFLLDLAGNIASWNKGAEKIKGYSAEEIVGKNFRIFYPQEDAEKNLPEFLLNQAAEKGKVTYEGWRVKKNGYRFWGHVTITALHDAKGKVTGFLKVTKDLTEKKVAEDLYNNMLEELRTKNEDLKREEERYHKMVSEIRDYAIILLDVEGNILDWNKGAEFLKGYKAAEIIGKNFRMFYPQEDKDNDLPRKLLALAAKNGSAHHEGYRIRKDGVRFWGSVLITALFDDNNKLIGYTKVTRDLTERKAADDRLAIFTEELKQTNEKLRRSEERYQSMIAEIQDYAILVLNRRGEIQNWNAGAQLIKGYESHEAIGKNFHLFYLPEDIERGLPERLLNEAKNNGRASHEGWRKRKDGSKFWASVVITALHDSNGKLIGFSKVTRDLTEKKAAEDLQKENTIQLELKNAELEKLNAELTSFAYVVSHDFKEPIRKIQVFANRLREKDKSIEQIYEYSDKIVSSAQSMQRLMESLLSYSRISNDDSAIEPVDLNEVFEAIKIDLELMIAENNAHIIAERLPVIPGVFLQIHQLFLNLVSNAIKFAHPDRTPELKITSRPVERFELPEELLLNNREYICLTFADNGVGFTMEQTNKIFEVFRRLRPKDNQGTGIGLAIVKKIALNHSGCVTAYAEPGNGATFNVFLPAR
jgi:PAS domain S-box-containing protein